MCAVNSQSERSVCSSQAPSDESHLSGTIFYHKDKYRAPCWLYTARMEQIKRRFEWKEGKRSSPSLDNKPAKID